LHHPFAIRPFGISSKPKNNDSNKRGNNLPEGSLKEHGETLDKYGLFPLPPETNSCVDAAVEAVCPEETEEEAESWYTYFTNV
jgi:hypothetical protein